MSDNVYNAILSNEITGYCFELAVGGICYIYIKKKRIVIQAKATVV